MEALSATFRGKRAMAETRMALKLLLTSRPAASASAHSLLAKAGHRDKPGFNGAEKYLGEGKGVIF